MTKHLLNNSVKPFIKLTSLSVALAVSSLVSSEPQSPTSNQAQTASDPLILGIAEDFKPFAFRNKQGHWDGIDYRITDRILKELKIPYKLASYPRNRLHLMLAENRIQGLLSSIPFSEGIETSENAWISVPYYTSNLSVFSLKSKNLDCSFVLINRPNSPSFAYLQGMGLTINNPKALGAHSEKQLLNLLVNHRTDCAIAEELSFFYEVRQRDKLLNDIKINETISERKVRFVVKPGSPELSALLKTRFNDVLNGLITSGYIDEVIQEILESSMNEADTQESPED